MTPGVPPQLQPLRDAAAQIAAQIGADELRALMPAPVVILSAPRSGSTLLFETLRSDDALWSIGGESHLIFNAFPELSPARKGFASGALTAEDATPELCHQMRACFLVLARNAAGQRWLDLPPETRPAPFTLVEKTPRNALNVPFMARLFPDMRVIYLYRDPRETIASLMEAWEIGQNFVTFPNLPGWDRRNWCLLLPPGWREMNSQPLARIAAFQWIAANGTIADAGRGFDPARWLSLDFADLRSDPAGVASRICDFLHVPFAGALRERVSRPLPLSKTTVSAPKQDKWRRHETEIEAWRGLFDPVAEAIRADLLR